MSATPVRQGTIENRGEYAAVGWWVFSPLQSNEEILHGLRCLGYTPEGYQGPAISAFHAWAQGYPAAIKRGRSRVLVIQRVRIWR